MATGGFRDTGSPRVDAQTDYTRARRRRALDRLGARLRREPRDFDLILPFEEVVHALGRRGERHVGLESIGLDSIVGSVGRERDFDRGFRPTSGRTRGRWERIAQAARRGESFPPIDVYRIGEVHFVKDGHHRVSVARAQGLDTIDAYVTEVLTEVGADRKITLDDLPLKSHERLFFERVPLPRPARGRISLRDEWRYAGLAEGVEAWGYRAEQDRGEQLSREEVAQAWFDEEYLPVVEMLKEAGLVRDGEETLAYMRVATLRYLILRTHTWDDAVIERIREELDRDTMDSDTMVHRIRREMRK